MTQEDKELLLKDLCARLPYGVMCHADEINLDGELLFINKSYNIVALYNDKAVGKFSTRPITDVKLYLRPMSSMTDEERMFFHQNSSTIPVLDDTYKVTYKRFYAYRTSLIDWLLKNHFDWRGLIELGIALEAPEGMYKEN